MIVALRPGRSVRLQRTDHTVRTRADRPDGAPTWTDDARRARSADSLAVGIFRAGKTVATASTVSSATGGGFAGAWRTRTGGAGDKLVPTATGGLLPDR